ncbi:exodeoxyribonuclease III [Actinobacteria bacterium IMCC26207]|nr:exodeoxyribonuclease III [Actinobacteria bacterium IMCC26207]MCX6523151.1 exodeoxyribonuclease III [Actinomycetota bacterium]
MLVATWNVNSLNARMERVSEWLSEVQPDVLCMQETKMTDEQFPSLDFLQLGYESVHFGQGRWNGVAILSKVGLTDPLFGFADGREPDVDARIVWATCGGVRICSVYVPNGRELTNDHYTYKLDWFGRLRAHLDANHSPDEKLVILGDFNVAPTDIDVWSPAAFEGGTHVSQPERDALQRLKDWGLVDTLRERYPQDQIYSFWDYRNGDFHKRRGVRIDFLLSTPALAEHCSADLIDRNARKGTKPSDHAPVMGVFDL